MKHLKIFENYKINESIWVEMDSKYEDEDYNIYIDAWTTYDDDDEAEDGRTIAMINIITGEVTYKDNRAKYDDFAKEVINDVLDSLPEIREKRKDDIEKYLLKQQMKIYNI